MNNLEDVVSLKISVGTLAILIAGLHSGHNGFDVRAIPSSIYIEVAEKISDELENWDYSKYSFEDWIKYSLLIAPYVMFSDEEIQELQENAQYYERQNGNMVLVVTWDM